MQKNKIKMKCFYFMQYLMTLIVIGVFYSGTASAYCDGYLTGGSGSVSIPGTDSLDLSTVFATTDNYSVTLNTSWTSDYYIYCNLLGGETFYYLSGVGSGYTVKFNNASAASVWEILFAVSDISETSQSLGLNSTTTADGLNVSYTLTATLVSSTVYDVTTTDTIDLVTIAMGSDSSSTAEWVRSNYTDPTPVKAHQLLTVTFMPNETTCTINNQVFAVPPITLTALSSGETGDTYFSIPFTCSNSLNNQVTRNANIRLYSTDTYNINNIIRNDASTSTGIGFQFFNESTDPLVFTFVESSSSSSLASLAVGDTFQTDNAFNIGVRYNIYDSSNVSAGSVVGTIVVYMDYN